MCAMHVQMYHKDLFVKQIGILSHEQKRSNSFKLFHINQKCGYCINQNLSIFKNYKIALLKIALNPVYTRKWKQKDPVSMLLVHNGMLLLLKSILSTLFVAWPRRKTDRNIYLVTCFQKIEKNKWDNMRLPGMCVKMSHDDLLSDCLETNF